MHPESIHRPAVAGPCPLCGRVVHGRAAVCFCCRLVAGQLGLPLVRTVVVHEYRVGDGVHRRLRGYKDGPTAEARSRHRQLVADDLATWVDRHADVPDGWLGPSTAVTPVPSTRRPGPAPAGTLLDAVPALAARHLPLLVRGRGSAGHLAACRDGFAPAPGVGRDGLEGMRVLVFDDSVTTGARSQSAAAALRMAGAHVVGILAAGRAHPPTARGTVCNLRLLTGG